MQWPYGATDSAAQQQLTFSQQLTPRAGQRRRQCVDSNVSAGRGGQGGCQWVAIAGFIWGRAGGLVV